MMTRTITAIACALLLQACGGTSDSNDEETPKGGVIGEAYIESLEEAEAVEDLALERVDRLNEEIDAAETPD